MPHEKLIAVQVRQIDHASHAAWAEGQTFRLPSSIIDSMHPGSGDLAVAERLRLLRAFTDRRPLSAKMPFSYRLVPARLRMFIAGVIGSWKHKALERSDLFPAWPLDLSADFL